LQTHCRSTRNRVRLQVQRCRSGESSDKSSAVAEMSDRLADVGQNVGGGCCASFRGSCVPIQHNVAWAEAYLPTKWHYRHVPKIGRWGCAPYAGAGFPSNTVWPGLRPTSMPSGNLIHRTVWPQYANVTGRQTGQERQRSDGIGRTVLQPVAPRTVRVFAVYMPLLAPPAEHYDSAFTVARRRMLSAPC